MDQFASDIVLTESIEENQVIDENKLNNPVTGRECNHHSYLTIKNHYSYGGGVRKNN